MAMSPRLLRPRAPGGFNPKSLSGLEAWFDASDASTITTVSGAVSEWRSKAGGTRALSQGTALNRPALTQNYFSGRSAITFDGSNDSLFGTSLPALNIAPLTLFVAVDFLLSNAANDRGVLVLSNSAVSSSFDPNGGLNIVANSAGRGSIRRAYEAYARAASGGLEMETTTAQTAQPIGKRVIAVTADGSNGFLYDNGTQSDTQAATVATETTRMYVGSLVVSNNPSLFCNCVVAEILVYRRALSEAERKRVESYLGRKWGVTIYTPPTYADSDVNAYIQSVELADGVQVLETSVRNAINDFIVGCKADGIWSAIKASCILMGARTLSGALTPLVGSAPTNNNFVSGDYDRKTGLLGNGTNKSLNANRAGNADPQDNNSMSVWVTTVPPTGDATIIGSGTGTQSGTTRIGTGSTPLISFRNRTGGAANYVGSYPTGFLGMSRDSGASFVTRRSGINATDSQASSSPQTGATFVFAGSSANTNTPAAWSAPRLAWYHIGESLDMALLDTRISTLYTAIGAAIP